MEVEGDERARLPIHMLASVVCFGRVMISPPLLGYCTEEGVSVAYLSMHGRFLARVEGPVTGNVLLRREQYRVSDDLARAVPIVRNVVAGKIYNQRAVLSRALRDYGDTFDEDVHLDLERAPIANPPTPSNDQYPVKIHRCLRSHMLDPPLLKQMVRLDGGSRSSGAWVETLRNQRQNDTHRVALFGSAWVETHNRLH